VASTIRTSRDVNKRHNDHHVSIFPLPIAEDIRDPQKEKGRTVQALSAQARIGRRHFAMKYMIYTPVKRPSTNSLRIAPDTSVTPE